MLFITEITLVPDSSYALLSNFSIMAYFDLQNWRDGASLLGHTDNINSIAVSSDGRMALSASEDHTLRLWNLGDQLDIKITRVSTISPDTPMKNLNALDIDRDGNYLVLANAALSGYSQPVLWDIRQTKVIRMYAGLDSVAPGALAFSPDYEYIAGAGLFENRPSVVVWKRDTEQPKCHFQDFVNPLDLGRAVAFSPDGSQLLAGSQNPKEGTGELILYDIQTCKLLHRFDNREDIAAIVFAADGRRAITGTGYHSRMILWDIATGKEIRRFRFPGQQILDLAPGPDVSTFLASNVSELYLWDIEAGKILNTYKGQPPVPLAIDLSHDDKYIVSGAYNGTLVLWDYSTGEQLYRQKFSNGVDDAVFSPDDSTVYAVTEDGQLIEWRIAEKSSTQLRDWITANRYVRELTCEEKAQYRVEPLCGVSTQ